MEKKDTYDHRRHSRFCVGLRCKTVIIITATVIAAAALVCLAAKLFIDTSINHIEAREAADALSRAWAIVMDDMEQLDILVKDWATWDETWDFMKTHSPEYVSKNLALTGLLDDLKISALLILDSIGRSVYSDAKDGRWLPLLEDSLRASRPSRATGWTRFMGAGGSLFVSAARPIVRSDGSGEWRGTLIMSKAVDGELIGRFSKLSGVRVDPRAATGDAVWFSGEGVPIGPPFADKLPGPATVSIKTGVVEARAFIPLPGSSYGAEIAVSMVRAFDRYGGLPSILFVSAAILAIVVVGMTSILLFEAAVLGRMRTMGSELEAIARNGDAGLRLTVSGNDELTTLMRTVNDTLERLYSLIAERDAAIREIHHRVKNNLQVISSLVSLQAGKVDTGGAEALFEIRRRVLAIAFVHEELYLDREIEHVDAERLFSRLASMVAESFDEGPRVRVDIDCDKTFLSLEAAVPLGLIFCEIVSNSFSHAFPGDESGAIRVRVRTDSDGVLRLSIDDDGIGMPQGTRRRLGLNLVETLSKQIRAVYEIVARDEGGTSFLIAAPDAALPE